MILEQKVSNPIMESGLMSSNLKLSEQTLSIIQEFLTVIQSESIVKEDIPKQTVEQVNQLFYDNYTKYYEFYRGRVCEAELQIYERLVNFVCMSSAKIVDIRKVKHLISDSYCMDSSQFIHGSEKCQFNVNVGIEYNFLYKDKSYVGVYCNEKGPNVLRDSYSKLLTSEKLAEISDGVIKVKRFKDGSYVRFRFMFDVESLDEVRVFVQEVFNNPLFKKWQFKGICSDEDIIKIRYLYEIQNELDLFYKYSVNEVGCDIKSMNPTTYKCMDIITKKMYASSGYTYGVQNGSEGCLYRAIRDLLVDICLHYFIPEADKKLFYKLLRYVTCVNNGYAMMGYSGLSEKSIKKVDDILENRLKMLRLIGRVVYGKSVSNKDTFKYINAFNAGKFLGVNDLNDIDKVVEIVTNLESYKNFDIENAETDRECLSRINDKTAFDDIGITEESVYLAIMAIRALHNVSKTSLRNKMRDDIVKKSKRFINKDDYELFSEIVIRFTTEKDGEFVYLPPNSMDVSVNVYTDPYRYYKDDEHIRKDVNMRDVSLRLDDGTTTFVFKKCNTNNRLKVAKEVENIVLNGNASKRYVFTSKETSIVGIDECYIVAKTNIHAFDKISEDDIIAGECLLRNIRIAELIKSVLII